MGVVYLGRDEDLSRHVALKTLPRVSPEEIYRLRREARTMAAIQHANLAFIFELRSWRGVPVVVMEYLEGGTLLDRFKKKRPSIEEALRITEAVAEALALVHRRGVLHRDVKPSNIGFDAQDGVKLLDFGIAHISPQANAEMYGSPLKATPPRSAANSMDVDIPKDLTTVTIEPPTRYLIGTPHYMSPEALRGDPPTERFDLWSLAVVLYEMVTGTSPYAFTDLQLAARGELPYRTKILPRELGPDCPEGLSAFLRAALALDPETRPSSANEFLDKLRSVNPGA